MNRKVENYCDGWAYFYIRKEKGNKNIDSVDELDSVGTLAFTEKSARNEDLIMSDGLGHSLSRKIKVLLVSFIKEQEYVKIDNNLYYIYQMDVDKQAREMYLYLESLRTFDD